MSALKELDMHKQIEIAKELEIGYGELLERQDVSGTFTKQDKDNIM